MRADASDPCAATPRLRSPIGYLVNAAAVLEVDLLDICEERWLEWMVLDESARKPPPKGHWVTEGE